MTPTKYYSQDRSNSVIADNCSFNLDNCKAGCVFFALLMFSWISTTSAQDPVELEKWNMEFQEAVDIAAMKGTGEPIVIDNKHIMLSERSYKPRDPAVLSLLESSLGDGVRFVRPQGMGNIEFNKFVDDFTNLLDESLKRSSEFRKSIEKASNGSSDIDFHKFKQGEITVMAIIPSRAFPGLETSDEAATAGISGVARIKSKYKAEALDYGFRTDITVDAVSGKAAPSWVSITNRVLEDFNEAKKKLADASHYSINDLHALPSSQIDNLVPNAEKVFKDFNFALQAVTHEFGHATAFFDGIAFSPKLAAIGNPELVKFFVYLEELENKGLIRVKNRTFNEKTAIQEMIDSGLKGKKYALKIDLYYDGLTANEILGYITGAYAPGADYPRLPAEFIEHMQVVVQRWKDSGVYSLTDWFAITVC